MADQLNEFRMQELVTIDGTVYKQGYANVWGVEWGEDGDIIVKMQPVMMTRGDSDCKYVHERHLLIPYHQVKHLDFIQVHGTRRDQCPEHD